MFSTTIFYIVIGFLGYILSWLLGIKYTRKQAFGMSLTILMLPAVVVLVYTGVCVTFLGYEVGEVTYHPEWFMYLAAAVFSFIFPTAK